MTTTELAASQAVRDAPADLTQQLGHHPLFAGIDERLIRRLAARSELRHLPRGVWLDRQGHLDGLFLVMRGRVRLLLGQESGGSSASKGGRVLANLAPGTNFGGMGLLLDDTVPLRALTVQPSIVLHLPRTAVVNACQQNPSLSLRLLKQVCETTDALLRDIAGYSLRRAGERVAAYLLDHALEDSVTFHDPKRAIASQLGIAPETLSRELRLLRELGIIREQADGIEILDATELALKAGRSQDR